MVGIDVTVMFLAKDKRIAHNQIKDIRCQVMGHNTKNPNKVYCKSLGKMLGFYKEFTYMIFNCTSFHNFNAKFYSIICYSLRILRFTITSFLWVMYECDYE